MNEGEIIIKIEDNLRGELLPDELKTHIQSYTVTWNAHIHFQTKVLKQLFNGELNFVNL